jgi:hypothetical protein
VDQFNVDQNQTTIKKITPHVPQKLLAMYVFIGASDVLKESWRQKYNTHFMTNTLSS